MIDHLCIFHSSLNLLTTAVTPLNSWINARSPRRLLDLSLDGRSLLLAISNSLRGLALHLLGLLDVSVPLVTQHLYIVLDDSFVLFPQLSSDGLLHLIGTALLSGSLGKRHGSAVQQPLVCGFVDI